MAELSTLLRRSCPGPHWAPCLAAILVAALAACTSPSLTGGGVGGQENATIASAHPPPSETTPAPTPGGQIPGATATVGLLVPLIGWLVLVLPVLGTIELLAWRSYASMPCEIGR